MAKCYLKPAGVCPLNIESCCGQNDWFLVLLCFYISPSLEIPSPPLLLLLFFPLGTGQEIYIWSDTLRLSFCNKYFQIPTAYNIGDTLGCFIWVWEKLQVCVFGGEAMLGSEDYGLARTQRWVMPGRT